MRCLHCGYCCIMLDVIIVDPEAILPDKDFKIQRDNLIFKKGGYVCPHLNQEEKEVTCKIHHYDWYKQTPCFEYTQIGDENSNCRMGEHIKTKNPELLINAR